MVQTKLTYFRPHPLGVHRQTFAQAVDRRYQPALGHRITQARELAMEVPGLHYSHAVVLKLHEFYKLHNHQTPILQLGVHRPPPLSDIDQRGCKPLAGPFVISGGRLRF